MGFAKTIATRLVGTTLLGGKSDFRKLQARVMMSGLSGKMKLGLVKMKPELDTHVAFASGSPTIRIILLPASVLHVTMSEVAIGLTSGWNNPIRFLKWSKLGVGIKKKSLNSRNVLKIRQKRARISARTYPLSRRVFGGRIWLHKG